MSSNLNRKDLENIFGTKPDMMQLISIRDSIDEWIVELENE